jgi:hypothetical protein
MSLRMWRFGGTILPTRFMVKTYWAMALLEIRGLRVQRDDYPRRPPPRLARGLAAP